MVSTLGNLLAFLGFCALVAGIISVIVPLRRLRIQSRGMGALTALAGAALLVIGAMLAPPSSVGETVQLTLSHRLDGATVWLEGDTDLPDGANVSYQVTHADAATSRAPEGMTLMESDHASRLRI